MDIYFYLSYVDAGECKYYGVSESEESRSTDFGIYAVVWFSNVVFY